MWNNCLGPKMGTCGCLTKKPSKVDQQNARARGVGESQRSRWWETRLQKQTKKPGKGRGMIQETLTLSFCLPKEVRLGLGCWIPRYQSLPQTPIPFLSSPGKILASSSSAKSRGKRHRGGGVGSVAAPPPCGPLWLPLLFFISPTGKEGVTFVCPYSQRWR